ncbi:MAG: SHOCT domain-containing protein [Euryarchaeota archaeon]|nr:SHOCT domain-containing protein [Euryarchaeota archaeon]
MTTSDKMVLENEVEQMKTNLVTVSKDNGHAGDVPPEPEVAKKAPQIEPAPKPYDYTYELERLAKLRDKGIITEKEFNAKKKQLLGL